MENLILKIKSLIRQSKPSTGQDIPIEKVLEVHEVLTGKGLDLEPWREAQLRELGFWRWVAFEGYQGLNPIKFKSHQKTFMLKSFDQTGWARNSFSNKTIVELGCGPLGMLEFIPGKKKIGIDPLNEYYSLLFSEFRKQKVHYVPNIEAIEGNSFADLVICFNVFDHTDKPEYYIKKLFNLLKPEGKFIFEVNCHEPGFEGSDEHSRMHPSPLTSAEVRNLVSQYANVEGSLESSSPNADQEFPLMLWGGKKA